MPFSTTSLPPVEFDVIVLVAILTAAAELQLAVTAMQ
jgi:hypothetical protein